MGACRQSCSCRFSLVAASGSLVLLVLLATIASSAPASIVPGVVVSVAVTVASTTTVSHAIGAASPFASSVLPLTPRDGAGTCECFIVVVKLNC